MERVPTIYEKVLRAAVVEKRNVLFAVGMRFFDSDAMVRQINREYASDTGPISYRQVTIKRFNDPFSD
ncbi:hypothetical protein YK56LOC_33350 [Caballeronia sp. HLA56]